MPFYQSGCCRALGHCLGFHGHSCFPSCAPRLWAQLKSCSSPTMYASFTTYLGFISHAVRHPGAYTPYLGRDIGCFPPLGPMYGWIYSLLRWEPETRPGLRKTPNTPILIKDCNNGMIPKGILLTHKSGAFKQITSEVLTALYTAMCFCIYSHLLQELENLEHSPLIFSPHGTQNYMKREVEILEEPERGKSTKKKRP